METVECIEQNIQFNGHYSDIKKNSRVSAVSESSLMLWEK